MARQMKKIGDVDVLELPILRQVKRQFGRLLFANASVRREAKSLLFNELRAATVLGMPMEEALRRIGQTHGESEKSLEDQLRKYGADTRNALMRTLFAIVLILTFYLTLIVYLFSSMRMANPEEVARRMAKRLVRFVERGRNLSDAMESCMPDYTFAEVMLVRAGENWGKVPEALEQLSEMERPVGPLAIHKSHYGYPLFVFLIIFNIHLFILIFIHPKLVDVGAQLGLDHRIDYLNMFQAQNAGILLFFTSIVTGIALPLFILRTVMNGTREMKAVVALLLAFLGAVFLMGAGTQITNLYPDFAMYVFIGAGLALVVYLVYIPALMGGIERLVLWVETMVRRLVGLFPWIGLPERLRVQNVWIASLALALRAGVTPHESIDFAGRTSLMGRRKRQAHAMELVSKGHPIGHACMESRLLPPRMSSKLLLHDGRAEYVKSLSHLAEEIAYENLERQGRFSAIFEGSIIILIGLIVFLTALSVYSLFNAIPTMAL